MIALIAVYSLISSPVFASCTDAYRMLQDTRNHEAMALMVPGSRFLNRAEYVSHNAMGIGSGNARRLMIALESIKNQTPSPERLELLEKIEKRYFRKSGDHEHLHIVRKNPKHPLKRMKRYDQLEPFHRRIDAIIAQAHLDETFCPSVHFKTDFPDEVHQGVFLESAVVHYTLKKLLEQDEAEALDESERERND